MHWRNTGATIAAVPLQKQGKLDGRSGRVCGPAASANAVYLGRAMDHLSARLHPVCPTRNKANKTAQSVFIPNFL